MKDIKQEIKLLINILMAENSVRSERMNSGKTSEYEHSALVHTYNNTLDIIKRMEKLIK